MAATGEVPFGRYYGSVDSTPLFLWLYGRCVESTGDLQSRRRAVAQRRTCDRVDRAMGRSRRRRLRQISARNSARAGQPGLEGFRGRDLSSRRRACASADRARRSAGLRLCGVHGRGVGRGPPGARQVADRLLTRAAALKQSFERDFWLEPEGMIALALDADRRPCRVMTSNGAHCLATGLVDGERATAMCKRLLADDMYSGWGIRTLSAQRKTLQSDELSQRLGVAARQRDGRARTRARRRSCRRDQGSRRSVRRVASSSTLPVCPNSSAASGARSASARFHIRSRAIRKPGRRRACS